MTSLTGSLGRSKGLTLVEVLVSIVIIGIGSAFILQALARAAEVFTIVENRFSAYTFSASQLAEMEVAALKRETFPSSQEGSFEAEETRFDWSWESQPFSEDAPLLAQATLKVVWEKGGRSDEYHIESLWRLPKEEDEKGEKSSP